MNIIVILDMISVLAGLVAMVWLYNSCKTMQ